MSDLNKRINCLFDEIVALKSKNAAGTHSTPIAIETYKARLVKLILDTKHEKSEPVSYFESAEYNAIKEFYGNRTAKRSGVPLINHIHEGIMVLELFCATDAAKRAYMLHPLFQNNDELGTVGINFANRNPEADPFIIMLAMEYRARANDWLSNKVEDKNNPTFNGWPSAGVIREVKLMLIADKIQNRKDFELYHKATHERSEELDVYFKIWLEALGVSEERYLEVVEILKEMV